MALSASQQAASAARPHLHLAQENCPYCEQPIPNERAAQVHARAEAKEREVSETVTIRLTQMFALEKAQIESNAEARVEQARNERAVELEKLKAEMAQKEAVAHEAGRAAAEAVLTERLAEQQQKSEAVVTSLQAQLQEVEREKAETANQLQTLAEQHHAEIERRVQETRASAEQAFQQTIAEKEKASAARVQSLEERLVEAERSKQEATRQVEALKATHETELNQRLQEQRDALETDKTNALNAANAKHFEETAKLTGKLEDLTRQLEKKTANELGEGAEINLFETLKEEFEGDRIRRVAKGTAGADIVHEIIHNGRVAGTIVYDSKNRNAWRNEYVAKLREDQAAAKAEHAILATLKFPAEQRQVCVQDGVIVANPARVIALVQMLRRHILQVHTLRFSNSERAKKTAELYDFIRSERCQQLFERIDTQAEALLKLQEQEKKAHDATWNHQGTLYRSIQRTCADLTSEIDRIIGTSAEAR
jgi:hypothetical protein